jgi:hypothetical protein
MYMYIVCVYRVHVRIGEFAWSDCTVWYLGHEADSGVQ